MKDLFVFSHRLGIRDYARRGLPPSVPVMDVYAAQRDARIEITTVRPAPDAAGIKSAGQGLQAVDKLHRSKLRRAGNRARRKTGAKQLEPVTFRAQPPGDVRNDVHHVTVAFDLQQLVNLYASVLANRT